MPKIKTKTRHPRIRVVLCRYVCPDRSALACVNDFLCLTITTPPMMRSIRFTTAQANEPSCNEHTTTNWTYLCCNSSVIEDRYPSSIPSTRAFPSSPSPPPSL